MPAIIHTHNWLGFFFFFLRNENKRVLYRNAWAFFFVDDLARNLTYEIFGQWRFSDNVFTCVRFPRDCETDVTADLSITVTRRTGDASFGVAFQTVLRCMCVCLCVDLSGELELKTKRKKQRKWNDRKKERYACTNRNIRLFSLLFSQDARPLAVGSFQVLLFAAASRGHASIRHQKGSPQKENEKQSKGVDYVPWP